MKICVDVELSLMKLRGFNSNIKKSYEIIKFAVKLHKSIKKYESADFNLVLNKFPANQNRVGNEADSNKFIGERRIQSLMNQNIIKSIQPFSSIDDNIQYYRNIKSQLKQNLIISKPIQGKKATLKNKRDEKMDRKDKLQLGMNRFSSTKSSTNSPLISNKIQKKAENQSIKLT